MGTQDQVLSGTGFLGLEPQESAIGTPGATGYDFKPVAKWSDLPGQIHRKENIYVGVCAFHSEGIKEVEFILNGGTGITVGEVAINPDTNLPEYFVRVNRTDVVNNMNSGDDSMHNIELRAIIRPNTGQVRILQHDMVAEKGDVLIEKIAGVFGIDGGGFEGPTGETIYLNERIHPGEHSYFSSILKENGSSNFPDIVRYIGTTGDDGNDGSASSPVKTIDRCFELIRDAGISAGYTFEYDETNYVDISTGVIEFLPGEYDGRNYWHSNSNIGSGSEGDEYPTTRYGYLTIKGDSNDNEAVVMYTPEQDKKPFDKTANEFYPIVDEDNPNSFNFGRVNRYLSLISLQDMKILREHSGFDESNWSYYLNTVQSNVQNSPFVFYTCNLFKNMIFENKTLGKEASTMWTGVASRFQAFIDCKTYGGKQTYQYSPWLRGNELYKNVADNLKQFAFAADNTTINTDAALANTRRIYFDPNDPTTAQYSKFNGLYTAIRDFSPLRGCTALDQQSWFVNPNYIKSNGQWGSRYSALVMYLKIKPETLLQLDSGIYKDKTTDDPATYTYDELGILYGLNPGDYFGNTTDLEPNYIPITQHAPFVRKEHAVLPHKEEKVYWGYTGDHKIIGTDVYDEFFDRQCMVLLSTVEGDQYSGFCLFDMDKPLVFGPDTDPDKQRFLFRFSGSTGDSPDGGHYRIGGTGNFYVRSDTSKAYYYSWAESTADIEPPRGGNVKPPDTISGATNNNYPILCYANHGTDDPTHSDQFQWFITSSQSSQYDGIIRIENTIALNNYFSDIHAQPWNFGAQSPNSSEAWTDMAFVNNVLGTKAYNYGRYSAAYRVPSKNILFFNNTMPNGAYNFGQGETNFGDTFGGVTGQKFLNSENCDTWSSYLQSRYPNGVTLDMTSGHFVFRNNYWETLTGNLLSVSNPWDELGYHPGYTGSISYPIIFENNYMWRYGTEQGYAYSNQDKSNAFNELNENGPGFKNHPVLSGGISFDSTIAYNYEPDPSSGLVGGGSGAFPFDIFNRERTKKSTAGAIEPSDPVVNSIFSDQTGVTSTGLTIDVPSTNQRYGKLYKIVAKKDGEVVFSENYQRFISEYENYPLEDASSLNIFEFSSPSPNTTATYETESSPGITFSTKDWLAADYSLTQLILYGNDYGDEIPGVRNYMYFNFYNEDGNGSTRRQTFVDALNASTESGRGISFDIGETTYFVDTTTGQNLGGTNSTYRAYLHTGTPGVSADIIIQDFLDEIQNYIVINKPSDM